MASENTRPPTEVYNEPWVWNTTTVWTPDLFETALQEADTGSLTNAADFCDALLADDRVAPVVNTRINGLLGCEVEFEADSARARKAIEKDWYRFASESELRQHLAWAIVLGVSIANTPFVEVDGRWVQQLHVWHPRNAAYDFEKAQWYVYDSKGKRIDIKADDPEWWVLTPYGKSRPWGKGTWRQTGLYWLGKSISWRDWQHYNEVHGTGILAGKLPEGKSINDPGTVAFWNQLKAIGKRTRIVLPFGYDLETIEAKASTWQTFPEAIKRADTAIAIIHLGQNLTTEVDGGSYAATVEHSTVRNDYLKFDAQTLSTAAHDGPLSHWQKFNFGKGEAPWPKWQTDPPEDLKSKVETQLKGAEAIKAWSSLGVPVDVMASAADVGLAVEAGKPAIENSVKAEIFKYHLDYGVFTVNEIRASRGMPPIAGGDEPPKPLYIPGEGLIGEPKKGEAKKTDETEKSPSPSELENEDEDSDDAELSERVILASGDVESVDGFRAGQAYSDKLTASSRDTASAALSPEIDAIMSIIEGLDDTPEWPKELKRKLIAAYGQMSGDEFTSIVEKALVLAELAGRYAVKVDV